jgi:hypothetical protein
MKYLILLGIVLLSGCTKYEETTTCYHPMVSPIPFELIKGDFFDHTGALIAVRNGTTFVLRGALCVTTRTKAAPQ